MLDMKFVRDNPELVMDAMRKRNANVNLDEFLELEKKRRELTLQVEALKSQRNAASQEIGKMKKPVRMQMRRWPRSVPWVIRSRKMIKS